MKLHNIASPSRLSAALVALMVSWSVYAQEVEPIIETSRDAVTDTAESQEEIDQVDARIQSLLNDYRANLKQLEQLNRYNASQRRQVEAQRREMASLREDINNIASLQRAVQPLMEDMVAGLDELVEADVPFLLEERRDRVERLEEIMDDPERSPAERYRLIVEAYQIENEYGRTIESYRGNIDVEGRSYENVEFLRIGRVALVFKTDDDETLKYFNVDERNWMDLDKSFLPAIKRGSRVAREQIPPELMYIPVGAPADGSSD
ncbi:MAG: DUF3450 domain-containing protein [Wenzhouxiangella sp.]|nr:DUF3450 domain-containing protein [Wenzhouxiangella sp.]MDR9453082.1 DUF3450 domain-containing protein [Wenzhouxiangella sp.]